MPTPRRCTWLLFKKYGLYLYNRMTVKHRVDIAGLRKRETYEDLIDYLQTDQEIIRYPDRYAKRLRESPYLTQLDGEGTRTMEQQQLEAMKEQRRDDFLREVSYHPSGGSGKGGGKGDGKGGGKGVSTSVAERRAAEAVPRPVDAGATAMMPSSGSGSSSSSGGRSVPTIPLAISDSGSADIAIRYNPRTARWPSGMRAIARGTSGTLHNLARASDATIGIMGTTAGALDRLTDRTASGLEWVDALTGGAVGDARYQLEESSERTALDGYTPGVGRSPWFTSLYRPALSIGDVPRSPIDMTPRSPPPKASGARASAEPSPIAAQTAKAGVGWPGAKFKSPPHGHRGPGG